jgi:hypothetical protein
MRRRRRSWLHFPVQMISQKRVGFPSIIQIF